MATTPEFSRISKRLGVSFALAIGMGALSVYYESSSANSTPSAAVQHMAKLSLNQNQESPPPPPYKKYMHAVTTSEPSTTTSSTLAPTTTTSTTVPHVVMASAPTTIAATSYVAGSKDSEMHAAGISPADYYYVDYIASHESTWCPTINEGQTYCPTVAIDEGPGGYGVCQSTPGSKMASYGADWRTNIVTQLEWCNYYANATYGGWYNAYVHWTNSHNW